MTKVTFETATLADSLKKASLVAPTKGASFDKAAGIVLDINPASGEPVVMRATNTQIYYTEIVDTVKAEGDIVRWRLPSLISNAIATFPIGSGKQVTLEQEGNAVRIKQGRATCKINLISHDYYPMWGPFDPSQLSDVSSLGERIKQVQWAASTATNTEPLNGIHFDGSRIICTDKYRIALADCDIKHAIPDAVTVPAGILGSVIRQMGDTKVGSDGEFMLLMPNEHTQIKAVLFGATFPNIDRVISREMPQTVTLKKEALLDIIRRCSAMVGSERYPTLRLFIGQEEVAALLNNEVMGLMGDVIEVPGQATHKRVEIKFTPKNLTDAIDAAPNDDITISYNDDPAARFSMLVVDGGSGYKAWVAPRVGNEAQQG